MLLWNRLKLNVLLVAVLLAGGIGVTGHLLAADKPASQPSEPALRAAVILHVQRSGGEGMATSFGKESFRGDYARIVKIDKNEGPDKGLAAEHSVLIFHGGHEPLPTGRLLVYLSPRINELGPCDYNLVSIEKEEAATEPVTQP